MVKWTPCCNCYCYGYCYRGCYCYYYWYSYCYRLRRAPEYVDRGQTVYRMRGCAISKSKISMAARSTARAWPRAKTEEYSYLGTGAAIESLHSKDTCHTLIRARRFYSTIHYTDAAAQPNLATSFWVRSITLNYEKSILGYSYLCVANI